MPDSRIKPNRTCVDILDLDTKSFLETFDLLVPVGWDAIHRLVHRILTREGFTVRHIEKRHDRYWEVVLKRVSPDDSLGFALLFSAQLHNTFSSAGLEVPSESIRAIPFRMSTVVSFENKEGGNGLVRYSRNGRSVAMPTW